MSKARYQSQTYFSYLLLNLTKKTDRKYYDSQDTSAYSIICYISVIEQFDALIENLGVQNVITAFPSKQHFQKDFNSLLLASATTSPSKCLSLINFASNFFGSLKKK